MKWIKEYWNESRGDQYDHWGETWYFFEINESDGFAERQINLYTNGNSTKYDRGDFIDDKYGFLCDLPIEITSESLEISKEEFETEWNRCGIVDGKAQW
jgi:hypothetical protein